MMSTPILEQLIEELTVMPENLQLQVLEFIRTLSTTKIHGVSGRELLKFAGRITPNDIELMYEAIEQGCQRLDTDVQVS